MSPSEQIDKQIAEISGWKSLLYAKVRHIIHEVSPDIKEEFKWSTAVFTHGSNICAVGAFKDHIKINFFKGATLPDPDKLFNAGLDAKKTRAIDLYEKDTLDEKALKELIIVAIKNS